VSKKKQLDERYRHLRVLLTRAKEDANRWGTDAHVQLLARIKEKSTDDFAIYDKAYNKFLRQRLNALSPSELKKAKNIEITKNKPARSYSEIQLARIADALERIADMMEEETDQAKDS
jgi:hypothetical protein